MDDSGTETTTREMDERGRLTIPRPIRQLFEIEDTNALLVMDIEVRNVSDEDYDRNIDDLPVVPATVEIDERGHVVVPEPIRRLFRIKERRAVLRLEIKEKYLFETNEDE